MKPDPRAAILAVLTEHAERGYVCPHTLGLAKLAGCGVSTANRALSDLRRAGTIRVRYITLGMNKSIRVVTIASTGKSTREPAPTKRKIHEREAYCPTETALTSIGRRLEGEEFARRKAELEAREAEARRKREMAL
jgi:hypothetical protein